MLGLVISSGSRHSFTSRDQSAREPLIRDVAGSRAALCRRQEPNMTTAHVEQDNLKLIHQGFEAFAAGDMAALTKLFQADAEWHESPVGVIVGNYHGRDAIFGFFGQVHQETAGTFRAKL